ncbi:helix-turn-helix domain-containing protein [Rubellimicrobium rubrum]|uniref:Helix-turn-helix domain-containing protein n=1 Tax=Rubellimicrobium rubrum TaxID=2585369 RepID=A0A5C4MV81_9RHOB|nr:helix-turn-helix transcriptional regulator [Rubellimicrobium rubrum]TNC47731.1 helix-turn-helix domain-containing protein [Rubellimicrobium rubrum]
MTTALHHSSFGALLQSWRHRRRFSQLDLATAAGVSQRHLSFVETGRASPSRDMVLHLADHLGVPARERNALLLAAGFAPVLKERGHDHPDLAPARRAVDAILRGHEPYPALAVDRHWTMVATNTAVAPLLAGVAPSLLAPAANVLRISLHPDGLGSRIRNWRDWRAHVLARVTKQVESMPDPVLLALLEELRSYPAPTGARPPTPTADLYGGFAVLLELQTEQKRPLRLISTTTVFGTALDVGLSELAIESFFPADAETAQALIEVSKSR